jgi:hypothetical protein
MPQTTRRGEQWDFCAVCDIITPMSRLRMNAGLLVCDSRGCDDERTGTSNEDHLKQVARILSLPTKEGEDRRMDVYFRQEDYDGHDI